MEKVSVIMPCFNDGEYIEEAVASVRAQTYENIELIIIDDGSDDPKTLEIIQRIQADGVTILSAARRSQECGDCRVHGKIYSALGFG